MDLTKILNWRYSTKKFDSSKKISTEDFEKMKVLLRMSPSSTNLQPWHFIIGHTKEGKERIAKGTQGFFQFNEIKVMEASHVIVFCARTDINDDFAQRLLEQEDTDGRFPNEEAKQGTFKARNMFADIHRYDLKDLQHWLEKQVYLNMGNFLLGIATLGIDAVPMEGIDLKAIDAEFNLREKGFTAIAVISTGYRSETDFNDTNKTPKSRLPAEEIITVLK